MAPILTRVGQSFGFGSAPAGGGGSSFDASGGTVSEWTDPTGKYYKTHVFTQSGTFEVSGTSEKSGEYAVIAGGGGGGAGHYAGGGGAGGVRTNLSGSPMASGNPSLTLSATGGNGSGVYTVTVGPGGNNGADATSQGPTWYPGDAAGTNTAESGFNSSLVCSPTVTVTSSGGGAGMGRNVAPGRNGTPGGSGGGGSYGMPVVGYGYGPTTPSPYMAPWISPLHPIGWREGNPSGPAPGGNFGSGGGGADSPGVQGQNDPYGGDGGKGIALQFSAGGGVGGTPPTGDSNDRFWFAGGGAGGSGGSGPQGNNIYAGGAATGNPTTASNSPAPNQVPASGGGNGGNENYQPTNKDKGFPGWATSGGGGGGAGGNNDAGGYGGPGVVMIRYEVDAPGGTAEATGGLVSFYNGKTIHAFFSPGRWQCPGGFNKTCEVIMVGGGGGGGTSNSPGSNGGGAGGSGGVRDATGIPLNGSHNCVIVIGEGGRAGFGASGNDGTQTKFDPSGDQFGPLSHASIGGGGGGAGGQPPSVAGSGGQGPGGSGGGGASHGGGQPGGSSPAPGVSPGTPAAGTYGGTGGSGTEGGPGYGGGGGGGAGGNGGGDGGGGNGGLGYKLPATFQDPTQTFGGTGPGGGSWVAGGGGGGTCCGATVSGNGGGAPTPVGSWAGGGKGGYPGGPNPTIPSNKVLAQPGRAGTGGGGGGGGVNQYTVFAGHGGSGLLLIAYPT